MNTTSAQAITGLPQAELLPPLGNLEARLEAERCLYCYDAPCVQACPTHIDIPGFIRKIAQNRPQDAGRRILRDNLLGATCSRVCPVKELCEGACVRKDMDQPIQIGRLQRHATDSLAGLPAPIVPLAPAKGKKVAVIGSGPAGLSCAGELARQGYQVEIFEKRSLPGGLSTHGIIPLREPLELALAEVRMIQGLGVKINQGMELGKNLSWDQLETGFDAVFLALGLGGVPLLGIPGDALALDGIEFLEDAKLHPGLDLQGKRVTVVGAGNTAIDCATVAVQAGALAVDIVYRRGLEDMSAYSHEYQFALGLGIRFNFLTRPLAIRESAGRVTGLACVKTVRQPGAATLAPGGKTAIGDLAGSEHTLACDLVISAIGQVKPLATDSRTGLPGTPALGALAGEKTYLKVGLDFMTSRPGVFAGGDCVRSTGDASTVMAVQDGKLAAQSIAAWLKG